jgi:hypothetical protein
MRILALATAALFPTHNPLAAQDRAGQLLDSGRVVRVHLAAGRTAVGKLLIPFTPTSATLRYCAYKSPGCRNSLDLVHEIPADSIVALDVRVGTHALRGAVIGGLVGTALTAWVVALADGLSENDSGVNGAPVSIGIALPTAVGGAFGSASPKWKRVGR